MLKNFRDSWEVWRRKIDTLIAGVKTEIGGLMKKPTNAGSNGQVLKKTTGGSEWADEKTELPTTGTVGQILKKTSEGVEWADESGGSFPSGNVGQILKKTADGVEFADQYPAGTKGYILVKTSSGVEWKKLYYHSGYISIRQTTYKLFYSFYTIDGTRPTTCTELCNMLPKVAPFVSGNTNVTGFIKVNDKKYCCGKITGISGTLTFTGYNLDNATLDTLTLTDENYGVSELSE